MKLSFVLLYMTLAATAAEVRPDPQSVTDRSPLVILYFVPNPCLKQACVIIY